MVGFNSRSSDLLAQALRPRSRYGGANGGPPREPPDFTGSEIRPEPRVGGWPDTSHTAPLNPGDWESWQNNWRSSPFAEPRQATEPIPNLPDVHSAGDFGEMNNHGQPDPFSNYEPKYPEGYDPIPHGGEDFHIKPAFDEGGWAKSPPEAPWTIAAAPVIAKAVESGWNSVQPRWMGNDPGTVGAETQTNLPPEQGYSGAETQTALDPMQTPPDISGDWGGGGFSGGGIGNGGGYGGGGYDGNADGGYGGGGFGLGPGDIDQILEYLGIGGGAGNPGGLLGAGPPVEMN